MILVVDNRTNKSYYSKTKTQVAKLIGISARTVSRWELLSNSERFNNYTVYFNPEQLICRK